MGNNGYNDEGDFVDASTEAGDFRETLDFTNVDFSHASLVANDIEFKQLETSGTAWMGGPDFTGATVKAEGDLQIENNWLRETDFSSASLSAGFGFHM